MDNKISFGFVKTTKKPQLQFNKIKKEEKKVELIDCVEGQSIKIKNAVEEIKQPLIIPIVDSGESLIERVKKAQEKSIKKEIKEEVEEKPDSELTIDELAARELIKEAQNRGTPSTETTKVHTLPLSQDNLQIEGKEEATLDDYENVPISQYGMAMIRGMGWKEGMILGKNPSKMVMKTEVPEMRPKGLGLGANKMITIQNTTLDKDGKELMLVKGAYAKIIVGNHKGNYCTVEGLDDENCRIIVRISNTNEILTLNEFLLVPVTKEEYDLGSKVINNAKYEEFKELSDRKLNEQKIKSDINENLKYDNSDVDRKYKKKVKKEKYSNSSDEERTKRKKSKHKNKHKRYSSSSEEESRRHKKKKSKSAYKDSNSDNKDYKKKHKSKR